MGVGAGERSGRQLDRSFSRDDVETPLRSAAADVVQLECVFFLNGLLVFSVSRMRRY